MALEVIDKGQTSPTHPVPLLFVHGAFHGAWCWDEHFLDFFAAKGYRALAVNLRGHGEQPADRIAELAARSHDYVDDVRAVGRRTADRAGGDRSFDGRLRRAEVPGRLTTRRPACWSRRRHRAGSCRRPCGSCAAPGALREVAGTASAAALFGRLPMSRATVLQPGHPRGVGHPLHRPAAGRELPGAVPRPARMPSWPNPQRVTAPMLVLGAESRRLLHPQGSRGHRHGLPHRCRVFPSAWAIT